MAIINTELRQALLDAMDLWIGPATGPLVAARQNFVNAMADTIAEYHNNDNGTDVWDDQQVSIVQATGAGALTAVTLGDTPGKILAFSSATNDSVTFYTQMPHRWNKTTAVHPHVHWTPAVLPSGTRTVVFSGRYTWWDPGYALPLWANWTAFTVTATISAADYDKHLITPIAIVPPSAHAVASSHLVVQLTRESTHVSDNYTDGAANVAVISLDTHFQANKLGTVQEYGA